MPLVERVRFRRFGGGSSRIESMVLAQTRHFSWCNCFPPPARAACQPREQVAHRRAIVS
jgi:hypothetical protein